jgi:hypothetical protein
LKPLSDYINEASVVEKKESVEEIKPKEDVQVNYDLRGKR